MSADSNGPWAPGFNPAPSPRHREAPPAPTTPKDKSTTLPDDSLVGTKTTGVIPTQPSPHPSGTSAPTSNTESVISPLQTCTTPIKTAVGALSQQEQRQIQVAVFQHAATKFMPKTTPTLPNPTPSGSVQARNPTTNTTQLLGDKTPMPNTHTGATPQTDNRSSTASKPPTVGIAFSKVNQKLKAVKRGSKSFLGNSESAKSALADGKASDEASDMSISSSRSKNTDWLTQFGARKKEEAAKSQSSGSLHSELTHEEESMANSVASSSTTNSKMDISVASSSTANSKRSKTTKKEREVKQATNENAQKRALKEWRKLTHKTEKEAIKAEMRQKVSNANQRLLGFTPTRGYIKGVSSLPAGKPMSTETLALTVQVRESAQALSQHKIANKYNAYCPEGYVTFEVDPEFFKLEWDLYVLCKQLEESHPGIRWDQMFDKFVEAPLGKLVLPPDLEGVQAQAVCVTNYIKNSLNSELTTDDFQKAFYSVEGEIPEGVDIVSLDNETVELCGLKKCKDNEAIIVLSCGNVFRMTFQKASEWVLPTKRVRDDKYEVVHERVRYAVKGQVIIKELGYIGGAKGSEYMCLSANKKSEQRSHVVKLAFADKDKRQGFVQVDHITHGTDNKFDDRFEHLRWADSELQLRNKSNNGVVGPIGEWFEKMRNRDQDE